MISQLTENLQSARQRIADAALRSGRTPEAVKLVAVTKYVPERVTRAIAEAGCLELGESRPQSLWAKAAALADLPIRWHMVGHLQRNKIQRTLPIVSLIHSGDRLDMLQELNAKSQDLHRRVPVLLEVNVSGDATKHGFKPHELESKLDSIATLDRLEVCGLMGMASREGDLEQARRDFANLRMLRDRLQTNAPSTIRLDELSMGMSGDFEAAIAEGATIVRIGSALFNGIAMDSATHNTK